MSERSSAEILTDVRDYIRREFLSDATDMELTPSTPLISGGVLSSIGLVKLVSFLESRFGVRFAAHEISEEHLDTLDDISARVVEKTGERGAR